MFQLTKVAKGILPWKTQLQGNISVSHIIRLFSLEIKSGLASC